MNFVFTNNIVFELRGFGCYIAEWNPEGEYYEIYKFCHERDELPVQYVYPQEVARWFGLEKNEQKEEEVDITFFEFDTYNKHHERWGNGLNKKLLIKSFKLDGFIK